MSLRDYGMGSPGVPSGTPTWEKEPGMNCPNCKAVVCKIEVPMKNPLLKGGGGIASYFGCPACPWASPCVVTANGGE